MTLIARTYWSGLPFQFRRAPEAARAEPVVLRSADLRECTGLYWTPERDPRPRVAVLCMHPRVDFTRHYAFPELLRAGIGCLGANTRNPNNDATTVHEEIVLDVEACVRFLREERGARHVVLLGNSGGGPLFGFYQAQATLAPGARLAHTPSGRPTALARAQMPPADALILLAAHRGEGAVLLDCIDGAVLDEARPLGSAAELDMYDARNGFRPPPEPSRYAPEFVARYRQAQRERVERIDAHARACIAEGDRADVLRRAPGFATLAPERRRQVERQAVFEPVLVIFRTMANLHYVDPHLDPSPREYGSLLSDRPDLMNLRYLGFARVCTPEAWLSTWSGLSSQVDLVRDLAQIRVPTLLVAAGRDREIFPRSDVEPLWEAVAAPDRTFLECPEARHYFEPDFGESRAPEREKLLARLVSWIRERFPE